MWSTIASSVGWTYGNLTGTCVDWLGYGRGPENADLLCVDAASYMESGGDSGAPPIGYLDDRAEIAGIHDAINASGHRILSPIEGTEADSGALGPVF